MGSVGTNSYDIPVPSGNGTGPTIDVSLLGKQKVFTAGGDFKATINVEASVDGTNFEDVATFTKPGIIALNFMCRFVRTRVTGYLSGTGDVDVGAPSGNMTVLEIFIPTENGEGPPTLTRYAGSFTTFQAANFNPNDFKGVVTLQASEDGNIFNDFLTFKKGGIQSFDLPSVFIRARVSGQPTSAASPPTCFMAALDNVSSVATNVELPFPIPGTYERRTLYVRPTGDNALGDGSLDKPYSTLARAFADIPMFIENERYIIDVSGMAFGSSIIVPPFQSQQGLNFFLGLPGQDLEGAVTIRAEMTTLDTVDFADVVSESFDPITGLLTIETTKTFTPGALRGKQFVAATGDSFDSGIIIDNTATALSLSMFFSLPPGFFPFKIMEPAVSFFVPLDLRNVACTFVLSGLKFEFGGSAALSAGGWQTRVTMSEIQGGLFAAQDNAGGGTPVDVSLSHIHPPPSLRRHVVGSANFSNCYLEDMDFGPISQYGAHTNYVNLFAIISGFRGCGAFGLFGEGFSRQFDGMFYVDSCPFVNSVGAAAIRKEGGGPSWARFVTIDGSAGDAVWVDGSGGRLFLEEVHSPDFGGNPNAGVGLLVSNMGLVQVDSTTDVIGSAGEIQVGVNAGRTWTDFRTVPPIGQETDTAEQLARLYE